MEKQILKGFGFGLTSGIITTLGLIIGLYAGTNSRSVIISGILIIAIADSLSDALGIHMSEESHDDNNKNVWVATIATFISKLIFALSFIVPILLLSLNIAIYTSIIWGLLLISLFSYYIAKKQNKQPYKIIAEHLLITFIVIIATYYIGQWINNII